MRQSRAHILKLFSIALLSAGFFSACSFQSAPEDVLLKMKQNLVNLDSGEVEGTLTLNMEGGESLMEGVLEFSSVFSRPTEEENRIVDVHADLTGALETAERSLDLALDLEWVADSLQNYLKINELTTNDETLQLYLPIVNQYKGKWIYLSEDFVPPELAFLPGVEADELKIEQQKELFIESNLFSVNEDLGVKKLDGVKVYHLKLEPNQEGLMEFYRGVAAINGVTIPDTELQDLVSSLDQLDEVTVYIGVEDYQLYSVQLTWVNALQPSEEAESTTYTVQLTANLSNHNDDLDVSVPEHAESFNPFSIPAMLLENPSTLDQNDEGVEQEDLLQTPVDTEDEILSDSQDLSGSQEALDAE